MLFRSSKEIPGLISFTMDWLDLLAVQGLSRIFSNTTVQKHQTPVLSFLYSPTLTSIHDHGKTIALTRWTFVGKVMSLLFNMLSRLVITFLPRSKCLLISWLQSPSAVILELPKIKSSNVSTLSLHDALPIYQSILTEISPDYSLEGLMLKLKLQYFGHMM